MDVPATLPSGRTALAGGSGALLDSTICAQLPELGWAIAVVVLVNGSFSFLQEYRAERATQALGALLPERALVLREGRKTAGPR